MNKKTYPKIKRKMASLSKTMVDEARYQIIADFVRVVKSLPFRQRVKFAWNVIRGKGERTVQTKQPAKTA